MWYFISTTLLHSIYGVKIHYSVAVCYMICMAFVTISVWTFDLNLLF